MGTGVGGGLSHGATQSTVRPSGDNVSATRKTVAGRPDAARMGNACSYTEEPGRSHAPTPKPSTKGPITPTVATSSDDRPTRSI